MTIWSKSNIILWDIQVKLIELKMILTEEHCDPHCIAMRTCQKYYAPAELVPTVLILKSGVQFNVNVKCSVVNVLSR